MVTGLVSSQDWAVARWNSANLASQGIPTTTMASQNTRSVQKFADSSIAARSHALQPDSNYAKPISEVIPVSRAETSELSTLGDHAVIPLDFRSSTGPFSQLHR
ncbi:MAG: hypothetical protein B7Z55_15600 [Planctomycetales bacterium 12-60-4]|nr:MAG: hypothetical protein B7Z55_15600 [Planctomycetales bacterium 12-60-4]